MNKNNKNNKNKYVYRQLYFCLIWILILVIRIVIETNVNYPSLDIFLILHSVCLGVFLILLVMILLDLWLKDDFQRKGKITEIDLYKITLRMESGRKKTLRKRFIERAEVYREFQEVIIVETRRSGIFKDMLPKKEY